MSLIGSCTWTHGPKMVVLWGKAMEPSGGRTLLKDLGCRAKAWGFTAPLPRCPAAPPLTSYSLSLLPVCERPAITHLSALGAISSQPGWTLSFWNCKQKPFLVYLASFRVFYHSHRTGSNGGLRQGIWELEGVLTLIPQSHFTWSR